MSHMTVNIELTNWYKRFTGGKGSMELLIPQGTKVIDAVLKTGIPKEEIGFITIEDMESSNGRKLVNEDMVLSEGDRLKVYPLLIGG
jgi:hypothetical protein